LNHLADYHENWQGGDAIQGDLRGIIFKSHSLNHFKMADIQYCEISLAQQWIVIVYVALLDCHGYNGFHLQLM
jgi:hypothetical protein